MVNKSLFKSSAKSDLRIVNSAIPINDSNSFLRGLPLASIILRSLTFNCLRIDKEVACGRDGVNEDMLVKRVVNNRESNRNMQSFDDPNGNTEKMFVGFRNVDVSSFTATLITVCASPNEE